MSQSVFGIGGEYYGMEPQVDRVECRLDRPWGEGEAYEVSSLLARRGSRKMRDGVCYKEGPQNFVSEVCGRLEGIDDSVSRVEIFEELEKYGDVLS